MSDVIADLTIHHCPPHRVRAIATVLEDCGWIDGSESSRSALHLGQPYDLDPLSSIEVTALTVQLIELVPEMAFTLRQSPTDEWPGSLYRYVPGLGEFHAETNHDGQPIFTVATILQMDAVSPDDRSAALGIPWSAAIEGMPGGTVLEPEPHAARWTPATGEIIVLAAGTSGADLRVPECCPTASSAPAPEPA